MNEKEPIAEQIRALKWQIHAETSVSQIMLWVIIGLMCGGWVWGLSAFFIIGNILTITKSCSKFPKDYLK
jgi:hypothetical protein